MHILEALVVEKKRRTVCVSDCDFNYRGRLLEALTHKPSPSIPRPQSLAHKPSNNKPSNNKPSNPQALDPQSPRTHSNYTQSSGSAHAETV
jgi:hypothetical protein